MVNGLIIIPPDGDQVFQVDHLSPGGHGEKILQYIYGKELAFDGCEQEMGYTLACYLAKLNYLVDTVENKRYCFYIGEQVFDFQYQWFYENKRMLRNTMTVIDVSNDVICHYDSYTLDSGIKPFHILKDFIEERKVMNKDVSNIKHK